MQTTHVCFSSSLLLLTAIKLQLSQKLHLLRSASAKARGVEAQLADGQCALYLYQLTVLHTVL